MYKHMGTETTEAETGTRDLTHGAGCLSEEKHRREKQSYLRQALYRSHNGYVAPFPHGKRQWGAERP